MGIIQAGLFVALGCFDSWIWAHNMLLVIA